VNSAGGAETDGSGASGPYSKWGEIGQVQTEERRRWTLLFSLARVSLLIVALAAALGWAGSFVGLHDYGVRQLYGFTDVTAWFIPGAIDGAAFATSLMTYRANIKGRAAIRGRMLMWAFTAASGWINWIHQTGPEARFVAAGLPVAAVAVFDVVLIELRADHEERHGRRAFRLRPGLLMLRYMVDKRGTSEAFRRQIVAIPVASLAGLGNDLLADAARKGQIIPQVWHELPQARYRPIPTQRRAGAGVDNMADHVTVPEEWRELPPARIPEAEPVQAPETVREPVSEPEHTPEPITGPSAKAIEPSAEVSAEAAADVITERVRIREATPEPLAAEQTEVQRGDSLHADDNETTTTLPTFSDDGQVNEREAARELVRQSPDDWTGKSLADRFGKSPRWGRTQIKAVRQELDDGRELVSADS
jgi:hypothetical protein